MTRRVVYHALAEAELDKLYEDIAIMAGVNVAGRYIGDLIDFIEKLATFPNAAPSAKARCLVCGLSVIAVASPWRSSWWAMWLRYSAFSAAAGTLRSN